MSTLVVGLEREYPARGAPKIRERLRRKYPDLRERTFQELGMPAAIRTDNGHPVGCGSALMV